MNTIVLGGGLAGLSSSYHLGHQNCLIIERNSYLGGHAATYKRDEAFWDEGPHVSFTKHSEVKQFLTRSSSSSVLEYQTQVGNYFIGNWIPHPAQSNLYAVTEPLARLCYEDFISLQKESIYTNIPKNYSEWLDQAFGKAFSRTFPHAYTRKYWTCDPSQLAIDWVGERVFKPDIKIVTDGYKGRPKDNTHYITSVRYPSQGGFGAFTAELKRDAQVLKDEVVSINLLEKCINLASGSSYNYEKLISTIPLDQLVTLLEDVPQAVQDASSLLRCSSLLLVNILGKQNQPNPYHWLYVYDEDKFSTRITQTHLLAPANTPDGVAGIQVEVYASAYKPFQASYQSIASQVVNEVKEMKLLDSVISMHYHFVEYANVIFDIHRRQAQDIVFSYLEKFGLIRESDDLEPMTDWSKAHHFQSQPTILLAGRFAQWKYFWSDDCILRGKQVSQSSLQYKG